MVTCNLKSFLSHNDNVQYTKHTEKMKGKAMAFITKNSMELWNKE